MEDEDLGDSSIMPLGMVDEADPSVLDDNSVAEQAIQSIIDDSNRRGNNAEDGEENDRGNSKEMRWSFRDASFSFDGEGSLGVEPQLQEQDDACEGKEPVPFLFRRTSVESLKLDDDEDLGLSLPSAVMLELTAGGQAWPPMTVAFDQYGRQE